MAVVRLAMACGVRPEWLAEGDGEMVDTNHWPFQMIDRELILALNEHDLGVVEGAILTALTNLHSPNQNGLQPYGNGVAKKTTRRKSA